MEAKEKTVITISSTIQAPVEKVWDYWNNPAHITRWSHASDDWHTPFAENDLREGGSFRSRMEARDGSMGFDFGGTYDTVKPHELIAYTIGDGRKVKISFSAEGSHTRVTESFEAEALHSPEMQQAGWQAILDNFRKYTETN